jgi:hypothetical protein
VDPTLLVPLKSLASLLSNTTSITLKAISHLLDYRTTNSEAIIKYYAPGMELKIHRDASYLSEPKTKSRIDGYFYIGNKTRSNTPPPP